MKEQRLARQVTAILEGNDLEWSEQGGVYALRFDSAIVTVSIGTWGYQTIIHLQANVLSELRARDDELLKTLNELNGQTTFGRWVLYAEENVISLEYDLLGDHLQEAELMTALATLARLADRHDDLLQARFGGLKATEQSG